MKAHGCLDLSEVTFTRQSDGSWTWNDSGEGWIVVMIPEGFPMQDGWVSNNDPRNPVSERYEVSGGYRGYEEIGAVCGRTEAEVEKWGQPDDHLYTGVPSGIVVPAQGITIQNETRYGIPFDHDRSQTQICRPMLEERMTALFQAELEE
jgi:hypothetical protein